MMTLLIGYVKKRRFKHGIVRCLDVQDDDNNINNVKDIYVKCVLSLSDNRGEVVSAYGDRFKDIFMFVITEILQCADNSLVKAILDNIENISDLDLAWFLEEWTGGAIKVDTISPTVLRFRAEDIANDKLFNIMLDIVYKYGQGISLDAGSTNLYSDYIHCTAFDYPWDAEVTIAQKEFHKFTSDIYEKIKLLIKDDKIIGIALHHKSSGFEGFNTYVEEYYSVVPFRRLTYYAAYKARYSKWSDVGYRQIWDEYDRVETLEPVPRNVAEEIYNILKCFNDILRIEEKAGVKLETILENYEEDAR